MHFTNIETIEKDGFTIRFDVAPETDDPRGHFDDDGETAQAIFDGRFEWFVARVTASRKGVELGADYLGGCCYANVRDFITPGDSYFDDMVTNAIGQARDVIESLRNETVGA